MNKKKLLIVIVTYNSEKHLQWNVDGMAGCLDIDLCVVDSGSKDTTYIDQLNCPANVSLTVIKEENVGFVKGNNLALGDLALYDYVLYLNPDAKINENDLAKLIQVADLPANAEYGGFTVPLIRYDINTKSSLNVYDSVGIGCNSIGRWYDLNANEPVKTNNLTGLSEIEAICGAFMLVRGHVLREAVDSKGKPGFESSFYMYKEDIELSCRIIKKGYKLGLFRDVTAFHCRGWQGSRKNIAYWAKYQSAKNDIFVAIRYKKRALPFTIAKYIVVCLFERGK